jgi:hypothetical protein
MEAGIARKAPRTLAERIAPEQLGPHTAIGLGHTALAPSKLELASLAVAALVASLAAVELGLASLAVVALAASLAAVELGLASLAAAELVLASLAVVVEQVLASLVTAAELGPTSLAAVELELASAAVEWCSSAEVVAASLTAAALEQLVLELSTILALVAAETSLISELSFKRVHLRFYWCPLA